MKHLIIAIALAVVPAGMLSAKTETRMVEKTIITMDAHFIDACIADLQDFEDTNYHFVCPVFTIPNDQRLLDNSFGAVMAWPAMVTRNSRIQVTVNGVDDECQIKSHRIDDEKSFTAVIVVTVCGDGGIDVARACTRKAFATPTVFPPMTRRFYYITEPKQAK